jgi:D-xylose transport system permease protein
MSSKLNSTADSVPGPLSASIQSGSFSDYFATSWKRMKAGDLGSIPILLGLIIIAIIFQSLNENFLTPRNFVNLIVQMAGITTIAIGVVYVLLLGEIDLSIGYVSAVAAVFLTLRLRPPNDWPWLAALIVALLLAAAIGVVQGTIITRFRLPSFVVTLAGLLVWNGVVLILIGGGGTVVIQNPVIIGIANYFLPKMWGWIVAVAVVLLFAVGRVYSWRTRRARGVSTTPAVVVFGQVLLLAIATFAAVYFANLDRGVPFVGILMLILLAGFTFLAERTRFGRYVYAIGGNVEAAQRAGIDVTRIRVMVFMISSLMAGMGGVVLASRLRSVDTAAGGGNLLLNSIAAAVIGGTSLFGGSGRVQAAFLGALVIASVENGMGLLGLSAGVKFVVTGLVLLTAVLVDAITRRGKARSGIA